MALILGWRLLSLEFEALTDALELTLDLFSSEKALSLFNESIPECLDLLGGRPWLVGNHWPHLVAALVRLLLHR